MSEKSYYVYALKDPRCTQPKPFYIGKGTGTRSHDHARRPEKSRKGDLIREIQDSGYQVLVTTLVDSLTENQALKIEAELIAAFGTIETGGTLMNNVLPSGLAGKLRTGIVTPSGVKEKAQVGLALLKAAVLELAKANASGVRNADVASALGLRSDYGGGSKDYLSYSILGNLMREGKLERSKSGRHVSRVQ